MGLACCREAPVDFAAEIELSHFSLLRSVGKGAFGKVRVVQHRGTHQIYALKYINKAKCTKMKAVDNIIQERKLLEEIQNNFVCNMRYAFQDDENLFMVIDLMLGGDLRFHLDRMGFFTEPMVRFIMAEISCALDYLHSKDIVHRDIKPDNILLDEHGHAHLTDFNIAVHARPGKLLHAVAGSMAYMAPEILSKRGYHCAIDWWSLGVVGYELLYGKRPFRARSNEQLTQAILYGDLLFPDQPGNLISHEGMHCLRALIDRDPDKRLGATATGGHAVLQQHAFFRSLPWPQVVSKQATPVFVPDSRKANFDATHELEELLLEDNPLRVKPRKKKKDPTVGQDGQPNPNRIPETASMRDMRIMDEKFTVYDFTKPSASTVYGESNLNQTSSQTSSSAFGSSVSPSPYAGGKSSSRRPSQNPGHSNGNGLPTNESTPTSHGDPSPSGHGYHSRRPSQPAEGKPRSRGPSSHAAMDPAGGVPTNGHAQHPTYASRTPPHGSPPHSRAGSAGAVGVVPDALAAAQPVRSVGGAGSAASSTRRLPYAGPGRAHPQAGAYPLSHAPPPSHSG